MNYQSPSLGLVEVGSWTKDDTSTQGWAAGSWQFSGAPLIFSTEDNMQPMQAATLTVQDPSANRRKFVSDRIPRPVN